MRVFVGYDKRQPVAYHVLAHSILSRASEPVSITPLIIDQLPINRVGLTEFTYSRYLVPFLCNYEGRAMFMDADMLCLTDICELFHTAPSHAVSVVSVSRGFERPSLMFFNNAFCKGLTPEFIETGSPNNLEWAEHLGSLDREWNYTCGYDPQIDNPKIVHFTQGIPCFEETKNLPFAEKWNEEFRQMISSVSWEELMGTSVHRDYVINNLSKSESS
jgi:hypothetical protein